LIAPEKYKDYHYKLLGGTERATEETAIAVAESLGVTEAAIRAKMEKSLLSRASGRSMHSPMNWASMALLPTSLAMKVCPVRSASIS